MAGTYKGPDTSQSFAAIRPVPPPIISPVNLSYFAECDPAQGSSVDGIFTLCGFKADDFTDITSVEDLYQYYAEVMLFAYIHDRLWRSIDNCCVFMQGNVSYVNSAFLASIKVKRNQFPNIIAGLPNHQFGYVLFGTFAINLDGSYTFCCRSDDG
jgi:hypothetical protein